MAVLHDLEAVAVEVDVAVKVHLVEGLHGDLGLAMVLGLVGGLLEGEVVLNGTARELGLLVGAGAERRDEDPVAAEQRDGGEEGEEDGGLEATAQLPGQVARDTDEDREDQGVREALVAGAVGGEGGILDGSSLEGLAEVV